jgi:hypothetical protein
VDLFAPVDAARPGWVAPFRSCLEPMPPEFTVTIDGHTFPVSNIRVEERLVTMDDICRVVRFAEKSGFSMDIMRGWDEYGLDELEVRDGRLAVNPDAIDPQEDEVEDDEECLICGEVICRCDDDEEDDDDYLDGFREPDEDDDADEGFAVVEDDGEPD